MEKRLADTVEDECLERRERGHEALEGGGGHISLDQPLIGRLLHAHLAVQVAAGRDLDEELRGMGPTMRRLGPTDGFRRLDRLHEPCSGSPKRHFRPSRLRPAGRRVGWG